MEKKFKFGVIGAGFMSKAIIKGALSSKILSPEEIIVSDANNDALKELSAKKIRTTLSNNEVIKSSKYVLFAIKPQTFYSIAQEISSNDELKLISIMAGVNIAKIKSYFSNSKVVRCMPNTPCSVGSGAVGIDANDFNTETDFNFIKSLFSSFAKVVFVTEDKLNIVTALSGSSPAYFYLFVKYMINSGVLRGIDYNDALTLVANTMIGSGKMILSSEKSLDELINAVCSKGGTTIEAINIFNNNNIESIIEKAISACEKRAKELEENL